MLQDPFNYGICKSNWRVIDLKRKDRHSRKEQTNSNFVNGCC